MTVTLSDRVLAHVRQEALFPEPGTALLAVSGGPDSVALLDVMSLLSPALGLTLAVAHVDHGIAADSADVAEAVLATATRYKVRGYLVTLGLGAGASETRARLARYRALRSVQRRTGAAYLVTAHHADDQAETVLHRFLKGSGPAGLAGIAARGPRGLVRPLLPFRRADLTAWLESRHPSPATRPPTWRDPANTDLRHDRAWLRHRIIPALGERLGDRAVARLLGGQAQARQDRDAWSLVLRALTDLQFTRSEGLVEVARAPFQAYDKALSEALLRAAAREAGATVGPARAERLLAFLGRAGSGATFDLGQGVVAELAFDRLRILASRPATGGHDDESDTWGTGDAGVTRWQGWEIRWRAEPARLSTRAGFTTWVSTSPGQIRAVRPGDRIRPLGGVGRRPVRRVLMEARVPRSERARYPLLVRDRDVVWIPGVMRATVDLPAPGTVALRVDASPR